MAVSAKPFLATRWELVGSDRINGVWSVLPNRSHGSFDEPTCGLSGDAEFIADLAIGPPTAIVEPESLLNGESSP